MIITKWWILTGGLFLVTNQYVFAQNILSPEFLVETGSSVSMGRETPFWLISNQYGLLTPNKDNEWIKAGVHKTLSPQRKIDFDYALELINRTDGQNLLYLHQAYVRLKLYFIHFQGGCLEEKFGDQDSSLSSGGLLWSGNARPMPKISLMVPYYTPVPYTSGFVTFKGGISHGWFDNNGLINHAYMLHAFGYVQVGGDLPMHLHFGFHHYAEWGGETATGIQYPHSFYDYTKVFFAKGGVGGSPTSDSLNALGNHLGSRNFGLDYDLPDIRMGIYWQTIFEDGSGLAYRNIKDGLWGFYLHTKDKRNLINGFVYEFINTTNQSGTYDDYWLLNGVRYLYPIPGGVHKEAGGNDNYFNNGVYLFGWTFHQMTIGTPLITSPIILSSSKQSMLNGSSVDYILNNKVTGHHIGMEGIYKDLSYKVFYTWYLNFGTNDFPFHSIITQQSVLLETYLKNILPLGIDLSVKSGIDIGKMYGNNLGFQVLLIKKG